MTVRFTVAYMESGALKVLGSWNTLTQAEEERWMLNLRFPEMETFTLRQDGTQILP